MYPLDFRKLFYFVKTAMNLKITIMNKIQTGI